MRKFPGLSSGYRADLLAMACIGMACNTGPTGDGDRGTAPSITPISGGTVYVSEPIDYTVTATDADGDAVIWRAITPASASFNAVTGAFSWRPAIADTGSQTVMFIAGDGRNEDTLRVGYTVVLPALAADEPMTILRPAAGETYTYGDTLVIAFAVNRCASQAEIITNNATDSGEIGDCSYTPSAEYWLGETSDSADATGRICRYYRTAEQLGIGFDIGFYKLPLVDKDSIPSSNCHVHFGGGVKTVDSVRVTILDPYIMNTVGDPAVCHPDEAIAWRIIMAIAVGIKSAYFSVKSP